MVNIFTLAFLLFASATPGTAQGRPGLANVLDTPAPLPGPGWIAEEDPFIVSDEASLSMVINGAAPRYMELGCVHAGFANYEKGDTFLMLEVYQAKTDADAQALYKEFDTGRAGPLAGPGDRARLTKEMGGALMLEFIRDEFYVRVNATSMDDPARAALGQTAKTLDNRIIAAGK